MGSGRRGGGGGRARIDTEPNRRSAILAIPIPGPQKYMAVILGLGLL